MSVGFYLFFTLDVQWAACGSVAADRASLRCSQAHQAFCFYSVWFRFVFRVMSFSCFEPRCVFKEITSPRKTMKFTAGCTSPSWKSNTERPFAGSLIWSRGTFMLFCLMNLPQSWQIWQILKLAVCMWGLMCQRGGLKSSPCSPTGTRQSPQANISWHFPWQHATISGLSTTVGEGMIAKLPSRLFFPPRQDT